MPSRSKPIVPHFGTFGADCSGATVCACEVTLPECFTCVNLCGGPRLRAGGYPIDRQPAPGAAPFPSVISHDPNRRHPDILDQTPSGSV